MIAYKLEVKGEWNDNILYGYTKYFDKYLNASVWLEELLKEKEEVRKINWREEGYDDKEDGYLNIRLYSPNNKLIKHIWFEAGSDYNEVVEYNTEEENFWMYLV